MLYLGMPDKDFMVWSRVLDGFVKNADLGPQRPQQIVLKSDYHDRYDLEADAVLHLDDGRYALIEFKLGSREIEEGAKYLLQISSLIKKRIEGEAQCPFREPDLLIVITGGEIAYTRPDGVKIIPIGTLRD